MCVCVGAALCSAVCLPTLGSTYHKANNYSYHGMHDLDVSPGILRCVLRKTCYASGPL